MNLVPQQAARSFAAIRMAAAGLFAAAVFSANAESHKVPLALIDGLPVVAVQLGAVTVDFLLDTGGQIGITVPAPLITPATRVMLGDGEQRTTDAAGHVFSVRKLVAQSVRLGQTELGPVDGLVNYRWGLSIGNEDAPEVTQKGVIGLKALASRNVLIDIPDASLVLFDRGGARPDLTGWQRSTFEYDARGVVLRLLVKGVEISMALDTAATNSMLRKDATLWKAARSPCVGKKTDAAFCGMALVQTDAVSERLGIGRIEVAVVQMGAVPFDGLLGIDFFRSRRVYLDFETGTAFIRDVPASPRKKPARGAAA